MTGMFSLLLEVTSAKYSSNVLRHGCLRAVRKPSCYLTTSSDFQNIPKGGHRRPLNVFCESRFRVVFRP